MAKVNTKSITYLQYHTKNNYNNSLRQKKNIVTKYTSLEIPILLSNTILTN